MAASATFALKAGVWFRHGRLLIISPVQQPSWLLSGRNPTYPIAQILQATSQSPTSRIAGASRVPDARGRAWPCGPGRSSSEPLGEKIVLDRQLPDFRV